MTALERKLPVNDERRSLPSGREAFSSELQRVFAVLRFISQEEKHGQSLGTNMNEINDTNSAMPPLRGEDSNSKISTCDGKGIRRGSSSNTSSNALPSKPLVIPEEVEIPLEEFRMAVTNLPVQKEVVCAKRQALHAALLLAYPDKANEVEALCVKDSFVGDPKSGNVPSFMLTGVYAIQGMQEIVPGLFVGSYHPATDKAMLLRHNITHILSCIGTQPRFPRDFVYMTIAAEDSTTCIISKFFPKTYVFIENALVEQHSAVLVHCGAGISRAPTIAAAYLIKKLRLTASVAIALIQHKRQVASPNVGFRRQLRAYQEELCI